VTLGLAILTALRLILEIFVVEEVLFSRCEYKIRCTIDALEDAILKLRHVVVPRVNLNCWNKRRDPRIPPLTLIRLPGVTSSGFACGLALA